MSTFAGLVNVLNVNLSMYCMLHACSLMGPCNHFSSLGKLLQVKCARVLAKDGDMSTGDISRASIYYDGAVKQDIARPVTEVNIEKPMNEKAVLFLSRVE